MSRADTRSRLLIVVLSIIALSAILVLVEDALPRVLLGALLMGFLAWAAYSAASRPSSHTGPPPGMEERREAHALRRSLNDFLQSVRQLDSIAREVMNGGGSGAARDRQLEELEKQLYEQVKQIRRLAGRKL